MNDQLEEGEEEEGGERRTLIFQDSIILELFPSSKFTIKYRSQFPFLLFAQTLFSFI